MNYFDKLPIINYNGTTARNLLARSTLDQNTINNKTLFYAFTVKEGDRADVLSDKYYDNSDYSWLIYHVNNIVDPYYEYPLSNEDFEAFIEKKYGSYAKANRKIAYYANDWATDITNLTQDQYNMLNDTHKKYFVPIYNSNFAISGYERKKEDWRVSTNRIVTINITGAGNFKLDEEIKSGSKYGTVTFSNSSVVSIKHVVGTFNASDVLTGTESGSTATVVSADVVAYTIPDDELIYWNAVSCYADELLTQNNRKEIKLLDTRYKTQASDDMSRSMKSNS